MRSTAVGVIDAVDAPAEVNRASRAKPRSDRAGQSALPSRRSPEPAAEARLEGNRDQAGGGVGLEPEEDLEVAMNGLPLVLEISGVGGGISSLRLASRSSARRATT